ncbi:hypothetical protein BT69DRAFT_1073413 [Atractiella rhizophila]|nr:hypothetical protein BT69DRAFT_1073413 [Atractiella rhizophila]
MATWTITSNQSWKLSSKPCKLLVEREGKLGIGVKSNLTKEGRACWKLFRRRGIRSSLSNKLMAPGSRSKQDLLLFWLTSKIWGFRRNRMWSKMLQWPNIGRHTSVDMKELSNKLPRISLLSCWVDYRLIYCGFILCFNRTTHKIGQRNGIPQTTLV